jgi:hypothetical protein
MPGSDGVYSVLEGGVQTVDAAFSAVYDQARALRRKNGTLAPAPETSVSIAVLDSGVVAKDDAYFGDRVANSVDAQGGTGVRMTRGLPSTQGQHGSHVASLASSGTNMVKILDVQVGSTQEGGKVELKVWHTAFKWAIEQRARIVNVSVVCPWSDPGIKSLVANNTGTLFLATSGNANTEFTDAYRTANGFDHGNVMLVSGCARNGDRQDQRGFGAGIDIFVPSMNVPGLIAKRFAQQLFYQRDLAERNRQSAKLDPDRARIAELTRKVALNPDDARAQRNLLLETKRLASGEAQLPPVPASADVYPLNEKAQLVADSGVSFGIPMVANVAAKMMLIMPALTPRDIIAIMKSTAEACAAGGVMDPVRCYQEALARRQQWVTRL